MSRMNYSADVKCQIAFEKTLHHGELFRKYFSYTREEATFLAGRVVKWLIQSSSGD